MIEKNTKKIPGIVQDRFGRTGIEEMNLLSNAPACGEPRDTLLLFED